MNDQANNDDALADDAALMTLEQLAAYLQVDPQTVTRLAQSGKIPCHKVGKQFRFQRKTVLLSLRYQPKDLPISADPIGGKAIPSEGILTRRRRLGPRTPKA